MGAKSDSTSYCWNWGCSTQRSVTAIRQEDGTFVVSAIEDGGGDLMLIAWATGSLARIGDNVLSGFPGEGIQEVALTTVSYAGTGGTLEGRLVTAVRTSDNHLRLIAWDVQPKAGGETTGAVKEIGLTQTGEIVTAIRGGTGKLKLIEWSAPYRMVGESWQINRTDDSASTDDLAAYSDVSVTRFGQSGTNLIVTSRLASGDLKVTMWED